MLKEQSSGKAEPQNDMPVSKKALTGQTLDKATCLPEREKRQNLREGPPHPETGWDLGPWTLYCSVCTWTNASSRNKIQRNYKGLKITACMHSWDKLWTRRYKKTKKSQCHFWRAGSKNRVSGAKAGYCPRPLHSTPPKGRANHLSHTSSPTHGHTPTLTHTRNQLAPLGDQSREPVTCFHSLLQPQKPQKSLAWISYLTSYQFLLKAKNPGRYHSHLPIADAPLEQGTIRFRASECLPPQRGVRVWDKRGSMNLWKKLMRSLRSVQEEAGFLLSLVS